MRLLRVFDFKEDDFEDENKERVLCIVCNNEIKEDKLYYDEVNSIAYCSYECYIKELNKEYFE